MTHRFAALLLLPLLTAGCALLPSQPGTPTSAIEAGDPAQRADRLRGEARILRYSGRYAEALARLDAAIVQQPDDLDLAAERTQTERSWQQLREELQDRMLVIKATEEIERLPLLERLVRANPADTELQAQLLALRNDLQRSPERLSECGQRQTEAAPELAQRCLRLADLAAWDERNDPTLLSNLEHNAQQPRQEDRKRTKPSAPAPPADQPKPAAAAKALLEPEEQPALPRPELIKAREAMQAGDYVGAVRHLKKLQKNRLDTFESRLLLAQAEAALADNTRALLAAGDLLYGKGMVKEALALWEAALRVDPYNPDARRKSERATRVLSNLEALDDEEAPPDSP